MFFNSCRLYGLICLPVLICRISLDWHITLSFESTTVLTSKNGYVHMRYLCNHHSTLFSTQACNWVTPNFGKECKYSRRLTIQTKDENSLKHLISLKVISVISWISCQAIASLILVYLTSMRPKQSNINIANFPNYNCIFFVSSTIIK